MYVVIMSATVKTNPHELMLLLVFLCKAQRKNKKTTVPKGRIIKPSKQ